MDLVNFTFLFVILILFSFNLNLSAQDCPIGDVHFNSQQEVDTFLHEYPDCNVIPGSVYIQGETITDLSALDQLTVIEGSLVINSCKLLSSLQGLDFLDEIGGNLAVSLENLTRFRGLNN